MARLVLLSVEILSATHRISCRIEVGATGLIGLLNDINKSLVDVQMAFLSRIQEPAKIIANFETATLNKSNLQIVIVSKKESVGPQPYANIGISRLLPCPVLATTDAFEVKGIVEIPGKLDTTALLTGGVSGRFLPIFQAKVTTSRFPEVPAYTAEAVLVNRTLVSSFSALAKGQA
jgi:hypothetical protein